MRPISVFSRSRAFHFDAGLLLLVLVVTWTTLICVKPASFTFTEVLPFSFTVDLLLSYYTDLWFARLRLRMEQHYLRVRRNRFPMESDQVRRKSIVIVRNKTFRYLSVTIPGQGIGRFLVTMNLFKTPLFDTNDIYNEPPKLMITDNNNLHVGLRYLQPSNGGVLQAWVLHLVC